VDIAALLVVGVSTQLAQTKPNIVILATGGTIAVLQRQVRRYTSGAVAIDAMIKAVPESRTLPTSGEQISNVGSQDMSFDILLKVAKRISSSPTRATSITS
jgi:L-asparaginase